MATEPANGVCPYCKKIVPVDPALHTCEQPAGTIEHQRGPRVPLADQPEPAPENGGLLVPLSPKELHAEELRVAYNDGMQNVREMVLSLFGVADIHQLIDLAEKIKSKKQPEATPAPDWDGIVTTLLESNAKLSETISAQGDQIMALSRSAKA